MRSTMESLYIRLKNLFRQLSKKSLKKWDLQNGTRIFIMKTNGTSSGKIKGKPIFDFLTFRVVSHFVLIII